MRHLWAGLVAALLAVSIVLRPAAPARTTAAPTTTTTSVAPSPTTATTAVVTATTTVAPARDACSAVRQYLATHGAPGYSVVCGPDAGRGLPASCLNHPGGVVWGCTFRNPRVTYIVRTDQCVVGLEAANERYYVYGGLIPHQSAC